ncbi:MAG TPA: NAD-dependent epimerase/dehydratase family protein [Solirubrobacteraceae bacterium]|nr:NAD-dependent epimerase/dehydratase family protein [Solirubrobacteraceae bacterium]
MRVLVTGLSSFWGGRLAQALERDPNVEAIIGVSPEDPTCELERTEYVRVGTQHALLRRIVRAAQIDTVVDSRLIVDSATASAREAHEANVIGTMNILAACSGPDSPVRKFVFKSTAHYYGCEQDDPAFFTERMQRPHPPRTGLERDIVEAEKAVSSFAERNSDVTVTTLRFVNGLGPDLRTSHTALLSLPVVPSILGFDPRYQFIHEDDIVGVLEHAVRENLPGIYNAAGDGVLVLSEVASLLGKPLAPLLPPWGTGLAFVPLRLLGIHPPPEMVSQLRFGRGVDNRKLKAAGAPLRHTSRETVQAFAEHLRVASIKPDSAAPYRYEREVEEFLRYSPSVRRGTDAPANLQG